METIARAHKQSTAQATIQEVLHQPMFRGTFVTCSRTHQGMVTDGLEQMTVSLENWGSPKKKSPKKPINRMCLGEESTDDPTQSGNSQTSAPQGKGRWGLQGSPRWGCKRHPRQGVNVKSTWPGCEVELGTCHCLPYYVHLVHTRIPGLSSPTTERYPLWW